MTRVITLIGILAWAGASGIISADTWSNVPLIDTMCSTKVKDKPDAHTRACALQCAEGGFGIIADGTFLKFDDSGNAKVQAALKASKKLDHLRVSVTGERSGETIKVASVRID